MLVSDDWNLISKFSPLNNCVDFIIYRSYFTGECFALLRLSAVAIKFSSWHFQSSLQVMSFNTWIIRRIISIWNVTIFSYRCFITEQIISFSLDTKKSSIASYLNDCVLEDHWQQSTVENPLLFSFHQSHSYTFYRSEEIKTRKKYKKNINWRHIKTSSCQVKSHPKKKSRAIKLLTTWECFECWKEHINDKLANL